MSKYTLEFQNDFQHSFMYLYGISWQEENHEQKILKQCTVPGTLSFRLCHEEGENVLQYDFSAYERACLYFSQRKMRLSHIHALFTSLQRALKSMEEYLLSPSLLSIHWEELFYDVENQQFLFPLIPFKEEEPELSLPSLLEQVLDRIEEEDEAAVVVAFQLYRAQKQESLQLARILQIIHMQEQRQETTIGELKKIGSGSPYSQGTRTLHSTESKTLHTTQSQTENINKDRCKNGVQFDEEKNTDSRQDKPQSNNITLTEARKEKTRLLPFPHRENSDSISYTEFDLCMGPDSFQKQSDGLSAFFSNNSENTELDKSSVASSPSTQSSIPNSSKPKKKAFISLSFLKKKEKAALEEAKDEKNPPSSLSDLEKKKIKKEGTRKMLLSLFLMLLLPSSLFYFKGSGFLFRYLPFILLLEIALLLYSSLDYLILLLASPACEDSKKQRTSE